MLHILQVLVVQGFELCLKVLGEGLDSLVRFMVVRKFVPKLRENISDVKTEEVCAFIISFSQFARNLVELVCPGRKVIIDYHVVLHHFEN